jgi:hypothetical protein
MVDTLYLQYVGSGSQSIIQSEFNLPSAVGRFNEPVFCIPWHVRLQTKIVDQGRERRWLLATTWEVEEESGERLAPCGDFGLRHVLKYAGEPTTAAR